jgi:hypothetical protein
METEEIQVVREIRTAMAERARPAFDNKDIEELSNLIWVIVQFYYFLTSPGGWPEFPDDPFHNKISADVPQSKSDTLR